MVVVVRAYVVCVRLFVRIVMCCVFVVSARSGRWVVKSVDVCVPVSPYGVLNFSGGSTCTHKRSVRLFM